MTHWPTPRATRQVVYVLTAPTRLWWSAGFGAAKVSSRGQDSPKLLELSPTPSPTSATGAWARVGALGLTRDDLGLLGLALAGAATMFLVQPPADCWMLAWVAPLPWLAIVQTDRLVAAHPWRSLWIGGFCHWLAAIHWLRLPHPATSIGWVALSAYLACYLPLFVVIARRLVHGWRWPLVAAAPVAWMACEHLRGSVLGGFTFGGLGHTQWRWTTLIQLADGLGAVGVGGVVMAVAAGLAEIVAAVASRERVRAAILSGLAAAVVLIAAIGYGRWRIQSEPRPDGPTLDVLLVQGSIDTELKHDPAAAGDVARHYDDLTMAALDLREGPAVGEAGPSRPDLIVWPETMWRWGLLEIDPDEVLPESVVAQTLADRDATGTAADRQAACRRVLEQERLTLLAAFARRYGTHWLVGLDKQVVTPHAASGAKNFNCGLFLDPEGVALACYSKQHPVMFGEYIPLAERFPWLYRLTPLPAGLTAGTQPVAVTIAGSRVAVNICYETALPEAVRSQVLELDRQGRRPDVLVNLTNDGWFWGSSELDMHLTAAIFRAIEVRTPLVIAANTGFSAWIDGSGRLLARGPRRATATLRARVRPDGRTSPWLVWGSLPLGACVAVAAVALLSGWARRGRLQTR
jgi:apolipoprotein N-acyltransferase